jgi:hypothetical protein
VFKKIMVKRNVQLQYEAMQSYKEYASSDFDQEFEAFISAQNTSSLPAPEELEAMLEAQEDEIEKLDNPEAVIQHNSNILHLHYK